MQLIRTVKCQTLFPHNEFLHYAKLISCRLYLTYFTLISLGGEAGRSRAQDRAVGFMKQIK